MLDRFRTMDIPYRLIAIDGLAWFCERTQFADPREALVVTVQGYKISPSAFTNGVVEMGLASRGVKFAGHVRGSEGPSQAGADGEDSLAGFSSRHARLIPCSVVSMYVGKIGGSSPVGDMKVADQGDPFREVGQQ